MATVNWQGACLGGKVEERVREDCAKLLAEMPTSQWMTMKELTLMTGWSRQRVRKTIRAVRAEIDLDRRLYPQRIDYWRLRR